MPATLNPNVTGWLVYDDDLPLPAVTLLDTFEPYDDVGLVPCDGTELFQNPTQFVTLTLMMNNLGNGANYAFLNNITYVAQKVPTLYSVLSTGDAATSPEIYGVNSNPFVLGHNEVVELTLNNDDSGKHPFHLHGHNFQVLERSQPNAGYYDPTNVSETFAAHPVPMRRDTLVIMPQGHFVLRFRSDNPGVWLFHCHIEWHVDGGLIATMVEAPLALQEQLPYDAIPENHFEMCKLQDLPYDGNAAANTKNYFDLTGANVSVAPLPNGFTARGIVALVFSCISAVLGIITIGWYGLKPIGEIEKEHMKQKVTLMASS